MRVLFFIILSFSFFKSFSDAGNAYRFYTEVTLKNETKITGYIYHYTYDEFNKNEDLLIPFLKKDYKKDITLYPHIISTNIGIRTLDFSIKKNKKNITLDEIENINVYELLIFVVGDKLIELSVKVFDLIKTYPPNFKIIHDDIFSGNCFHLLISWNKKSSFNKIEKDFSTFLNKRTITSSIEIESIDSFLEAKKEELFKQQILLINYCEAL